MNTKMKQIALPLIVVIAVLLAFSSPAAADYSGDKPLVTYDTDVIYGGLVFETVTDGSTYTVLQAKPERGKPLPNLTQQITINIPAGATVKTARLYNYVTWSTADYGNGTNPGMPAEADIWFNGVQKVCKLYLGDNNRSSLANPINYGNGVIQYWDSKGQGYDPACTSYARKYDNPYGTFAWDVTDIVKPIVDSSGSGTFTAKIQNDDTTPTAGLPGKPYKYWERFVTWGFGLVVVYEHPDIKPNVEYWIDEGCDLLLNRTCYETAESATTYAPFDGVVNWGDPAHEPWDRQMGNLTTVLMGSDKGNEIPPQNMVSFNSNWIGPSTAVGNQAIGVNNFVDVPLIHKDNIADFQDRSDNVVVSNAFLVVEKQNPLWHEINDELDTLIENVSEATMPSIIQRRLIDKLEYAEELKHNAKIVCEEGNFEGATKKLGVAKSQVDSFERMVRITRRISAKDKASFLADSAEIKGKIQALIEYIETEHKC